MHDCQRFREDWVAGIIDSAGDCAECRVFCEEAGVILHATKAEPQLIEFQEPYWNGFDARLRQKLVLENNSRISTAYWKWSVAAVAAALALAVSLGNLSHFSFFSEQSKPERAEFNEDHMQGLDPMVVTFLGQSEMFLRSFTKIEPSDTEDLADAQSHARQQLMETTRQRKLAANFVPVRITLDEYEGVLRDIKNLDSPEDLSDIQMRIERNGLIANLKAYQPRIMLISQR